MKILLPVLIGTLLLSNCNQQSNQNQDTYKKGEIEERLQMAYNRIMNGNTPQITAQFLLACLNQDQKYKRRFTEYSGDQPGRYLSIMSLREPTNNPVDLKNLVSEILSLQRPDGRFGDLNLEFNSDNITGEHMALLWGNGRLLAGMLDYYEKYKDEKVLESAKKLAEFLISTTRSCTTEKNIGKLKNMGAMGFICFTQNLEGFVKLGRITGDNKYIALSEKIYPLLPEKGNQHSHGFLLTLRGTLMLWNYTHKKEQLNFVREKYNEVLNGKEFQVTGGVPEFFGSQVIDYGFRNEGCSESDFMMLSFELWKATGEVFYLEKAEYCLYNELYYNQYKTGDFGSHHIDTTFGFRTYFDEDRAWWCCTYHGIMGLDEAEKSIVTLKDDTVSIHLYLQTRFKNSNTEINLFKDGQNYEIWLDKIPADEFVIALRKTSWAKSMKIMVDYDTVHATLKGDYYYISRKWKNKDIIKISFDYKIQIQGKSGKRYTLENFPNKVTTGAIQYGPYLLAVDDDLNWEYMSEPGFNNVIFLDEKSFVPVNDSIVKQFENSKVLDGYVETSYSHEGMYGKYKVVMRPLSENTFQHPSNVRIWFNIEKFKSDK